MPFFGAEFFGAVEGYSNEVAVGYMRALWHYWNHTHCEGLPNDDAYLMRICRCEPTAWARTRGVIFDDHHFFTMNGDGKWHQKRAKEIHSRETELYRRRLEYAQTARDSRTVNSVIKRAINTGQLTSAERVCFDRERDRVELEMRKIVNTYGGHQNWDQGDRKRYLELKARLKELREILGVKV